MRVGVAANAVMQNIRRCLPASLLVALLSLCIVAPAWGQSNLRGDDGYYKVVGIADNDVLNLRAKPGGDVIASIKNGDVVASDGTIVTAGDTKWQKVSTPKAVTDGWVAARYLKRAEPILYPGYTSLIPLKGDCFGAEPFWGFTWTASEATFQDENLEHHTVRVLPPKAAEGAGDADAFLPATGDGMTIALLLIGDGCFYLPTDRSNWGVAKLFVSDQHGTRLFVGCCVPVADAWR